MQNTTLFKCLKVADHMVMDGERVTHSFITPFDASLGCKPHTSASFVDQDVELVCGAVMCVDTLGVGHVIEFQKRVDLDLNHLIERG
jgi:hypothetical protein